MSTENLQLTKPPVMREGTLIRRPVAEVFEAFANPDITSRFWYTKSSGRMETGAQLRWEWEMYGVGADVNVLEVEQNRRIVFTWTNSDSTTVTFRFIPWENDTTYFQVIETGFTGTGDEIAETLVGTTGGYVQVMCAAKALLEHDIILTVVLDHAPPGLDLD